MPTLYGLAREFRKQFLRGEREAQARLARAYQTAYESVQRELTEFGRKMADAKREGELSRSWLFREGRFERIARHLELAGAFFAGDADRTTQQGQRRAIDEATSHAGELIRTGAGTFQRANLEATYQLVGTLGDGSPLRATLESAARGAVEAAEDILTTAVATGKNPRVAAREMKDAAGVPAVRASTIARTEILRSYRSASLDNYQANDDVLEGWVWLATLDNRTCAVCWIQHGSQFSLDEEFGSHPNCRCSPMPLLIGVPSGVESGALRLERASAETLSAVLGPRTYEAYLNKQIALRDLVGVKEDPEWGTVRYRRPLRELLSQERKAA